MRSTLLFLFKTLLLLLIPAIVFSQKSEHTVQLNSGKLFPAENISYVNKDSSVFQKSLFQNKYYIVLQFQQLPDEATKKNLKAAGVELIDYLSGNSYTASVNKEFEITTLRTLKVRSIFQLKPENKVTSEIAESNYPSHAIKEPGFIDVNVVTYSLLNPDSLKAIFKKLNIVVLENQPMYRMFVLRVPVENISKLIGESFVQWVEPIDPPNQKEDVLGRSLHRTNVLNDGIRNLKGTGIRIGVWDGGEIDRHLDFLPASRLIQKEQGSTSSHSTHVGGIIGSAGLIDPKARGMAPNATIYSYDFSVGSTTVELFNAIPELGLSISNHSYGGSVATCAITGSQIAYSTTSRATDINLNTYPNHLHVHSAGNSQSSCTGGWYTVTGSGKSAKNNIVVANIQSNETISTSSSFGPVHDGRIKPEISGFGTNVLSTYTPNNSYGTISGTSMSSPAIAGTLALLVERFKQLNSNAEPLSSLIKGIACNTATDLGNPGPDYKFGFGRINALAAVKAIEENRFEINAIATGQTNNLNINVPPGAARLKVMLTWNDPAAAANASFALVNNLDLTVIQGATTTLPWVLNPVAGFQNNNATRAVDNISNIEQVTLDNPTSGNYTLSVNGAAVPIGSSQQYSLTWVVEMPFIEVTYPNGGESFDPGSVETITWDNAGVTGTQTVQYSIDNGTNWINISTSVLASTTRLVWTVPSGINTAQAKFRVFSGALSDDSDNSFNILGTPKNFKVENTSCQAGSLNLSWTAVTDATHYDLLVLNIETAQWEIFSSDITGNSYTATGLTGGQNYWFTIKAKNNTKGSISERAYAIEKIAPAGNLSVPGVITGAISVCSNSKGAIYSIDPVAGATSYIWTVPTGASIVNGQSTTSILVDFGPSATSGSIKVFASNGNCNTGTSDLAITIIPGPALTVSPINPTICSPGSVNLTASAPGSVGTTYAWSPATGLNITTGSVVNASPLFTTIYTVVATDPNGCVATINATVYVGNAATSTSSNSPVCEGATLNLFTSPAVSNKYSSVKITEVVQFRDGAGSTPVYPFYNPSGPSNAEDMVEISNVDNTNPVDVSGMRFELWTGTTMNRSFTIPNGVIIPANQVMVLFMGTAGGVDNFEFRYFRTGGSNNPVSSSAAAGWLIKSPAGSIIDVVATNSYSWPVASGVINPTHWSGNIASSLNLSGVIRTAAIDNNTAANWAVSSSSLLQSIGTYNGGYTNVSPYAWSGPSGFTSTAQNPILTNIQGTMGGIYTVTFTGGDNGCVGSQNTNVVVNPGPAPIISASANFPVCIGGTLNLSATSSQSGSTYSWTGPNGFVSSVQNPIISSVSFVNAGTYTVTITGAGCTQTASVTVQLKQLNGIYKIGPGADYNSLTEAVNDYNNSSCIQGAIVFELLNSYNPAYESWPISINNSPGASVINTLTIRPATGANPQIISSVNGGSIFRFNGARYVTIDGRIGSTGSQSSLRIENLSTSSLAGTSAISFVNGAQENTINYVKILNGTTNGSQSAGNILFSTSSTGGNNNNIISNNYFAGSQESQTQIRYAVVCDGSNDVPNAGNIISNNEFASVVFRAVTLNAGLGNNWQILNNQFYWSGGTSSTGGQRPLVMNNTASSGHIISGNFIGGSQPNAMGSWANTTGTWYGLDLTVGTNEVTTISNNTIRNVSTTTTSTNYTMIGIGMFAGSYNVSGNIISDLTNTSTGANPLMAGIYYQNTEVNKNFRAYGNNIFNLSNNAATANPAAIYGMVNQLGLNEVATIERNKIYNLNIPNSTSIGSTVSGLLLLGSASNDTFNVINNMIGLGSNEANNISFFGIQNAAKSARINAYYNSVLVDGTVTAGSNNSGAFFRNGITSVSEVLLRNNIFQNNRSGGTGMHYAVINNNPTPSTGWAAGAGNYNNLFSSNSSNVGLWGATPLDFATWQSTTGSANSVNHNVLFQDIPNGDLRVKEDFTNCGFDNLGTPVSNITTDYFSTTRHSSKPDIGAHEFTFVPDAPVSGGDQVVCATSPIQTLTATATVPAGHIIEWYSLPTGGSIVTNPTLNTIGTITYYAQAKNSTAGCISVTRTAVTLTINSAPVITCPANITVSNTTGQCGAIVNYPVATATGSPAPTITYSMTSGTFFPVGTTTITVNATNSCGTASCSFTVTVNDTQAPSVTCPVNVTRTTDPAACTATFAPLNPTTGDNCAVTVQTWSMTGATTATSPATGINTVGSRAFNIGVTTISYIVKDAAGNTNTCSQTITITDGQLPVINTQPTNKTVCVGTTATFSVAAVTAPTTGGPLTYQWQSWNGSSWTNIAGTTNTLTLTNVTQSMNTNSYRVIVTGMCTPVTSNFATLYVNPLPTINLTSSISPILLPTQTTNIIATVSPAGGSFAWTKNGSPRIPTVITGTLTNLGVDDAGTYKAVYTDLNGCVNTSNEIVISAAASDNFFVAPNPNFGQFWVRYYNQTNDRLTLRVFNASGQLVHTQSATSTLPYTRIDVNLTSNKIIVTGIYTVELRSGSGNLLGSKKIIINYR